MSGPAKVPQELELLRFELDVIDDQILDLLLARFRRLERVAQVKARENLPGHDPTRERAILERLERKLAHLGLVPEHRHDLLEIARAVLDRGRAHVKRRSREIASARHDRVDGKLDPGAGRAPREDGQD